MSESPQLQAVNTYLASMKTFDVEKLQHVTAPSFTVEVFDENNTKHEFTRAQVIEYISSDIKQYHTQLDISKQDAKQTSPTEVILEGEVVIQPSGHTMSFRAPWKFEGDKISKLVVHAKAVDFKQFRVQ